MIFLWVDARRPARGRRSVEEFVDEKGLLGVKGVGRVGLSVEDALDDELDMRVDVQKVKCFETFFFEWRSTVRTFGNAFIT